MSALVRRAGLAFAGTLLGEIALLFVIAQLAAIPLARFETGLLLGATTLLGAVWGLRDHLRHRAPGPLLAALVPPVATALFLSPRLARGAPADALLTLALCVVAAAPIERIWTRHVLRTTPTPSGHGLRVAGPGLGLLLVVLAVHRAPMVFVAVGVSFLVLLLLAVFVAHRALATEHEATTLAARLRGFAAQPDTMVIPDGEPVHDPWLVDLEARLRARVGELAEDAEGARLAETELDDVRQLRSRFMASMSHDLKSPLNSIVGFSQILEAGLDGELSDAQRQSVSMIRRSAEELILLLTDTLDLARLEAGRLELSLGWVPSVEILTEAVRRGRALVAGREVEIEAELQPGLPPVASTLRESCKRWSRSFAMRRSMERTTVRLRARAALGPPGPEQRLRLEFYDAVGALPSEEVEKIFEAFEEISAPAGAASVGSAWR
ncbi:MAG: histidine kinase dimerization/phospho-acceptor domain-containing protein [Sandaracinaceae bacterium]